RFEEQARQQTRRAAGVPTEGHPTAGLKPWKDITTPHPDVASGKFQQAEFAADLWQVYLDQGSDEYRDPTEFYRRTYLTEGLQQLLRNALLRLSGQSGDPVIELQTNFGGGKTHAMLALFHLCQALQISDLPGMEALFQTTGINHLPQNVNVAVLVGNKLQPSGIVPYKPEHSSQKRPMIRTLWGELAWQLGGAKGYELVRRADETSTNPGDTLTQLFNHYAPCLILIDEWVSYARQLHENSDLAGGSFDTQFTFAQTLSESAKNAKNTLLVVSIPSSDIEIGGDRGKEALDRLKNAIGRVESPWRPASAEESFEIVRRRLFQPNTDPSLFVQRDGVIKAFMELYRTQSQEFPSECKEADYERRMKAAYPIHPELFDRLYTDWSTLDKFQRTRGVLRLMAKVIHSLWDRGDKNLLIMPASVSMDDAQV
ncbi:MAG: ATP-binding protein, partial [Synechococcales cyanobacterium]